VALNRLAAALRVLSFGIVYALGHKR
jgi:hypothetical protein